MGGMGGQRSRAKKDLVAQVEKPRDERLRVLITDDHPVIRAGVSSFLKAAEDLVVVGEAADGREAVEMAGRLKPDVILMDLLMPRMNGVDATCEILATQPETRIVILTGTEFEEESFHTVIRAGAVGYLTKGIDTDLLLQAVRRADRGELALDPGITSYLVTRRFPGSLPTPPPATPSPPKTGANAKECSVLTPRQIEILRGLAQDRSSRDIATGLGVSESTVRSHLSRIFKSLGLEGRLDLLRALRRIQRGEPSALPREVAEQLRVPSPSTPSSNREATVVPRDSPLLETLTQRESEVLSLLAEGLTNQQIADDLYISEVTVRSHVSRLLKKLGLKNRIEAAFFLLRRESGNLESGLMPPRPSQKGT